MSCCGKNRESLRRADQPAGQAAPAAPKPAGPAYVMPAPREVYFQYTGQTSLTVIGPMTRARYVFAHPGAVEAVDSRDAPSFSAVPHLRAVRKVG